MSLPDNRQQDSTLLRRLLRYLSLDWLSFALDIIQYIRKWLCKSPSSPYEILDYESTLELLDTTGKRAIFRKLLQIKFIQDGVIAFEDYAWGDGQILAAYKCVPGVLVDKYREGDRWNLLISLRETKNVGDIEEFYIERRERNTFTKTEEWLQTEIRRHTRRLRMNVIFPKKRTCKRAVLIQRKSNRMHILGPEHVRTLPDNRQLVSWETTHIQTFDVYTLKW